VYAPFLTGEEIGRPEASWRALSATDKRLHQYNFKEKRTLIYVIVGQEKVVRILDQEIQKRAIIGHGIQGMGETSFI
jgi:hypothetical protein